jgi:hypothetical protein
MQNVHHIIFYHIYHIIEYRSTNLLFLSIHRVLVHIVDPEEERRKALEKKVSMWDGFGESVAWDDDDVRAGDFEPLPVVEGVKFVGITGDHRRNMALTQCVMTMSKFCLTAFAFREYAYSMCIHEELCDVGLVRRFFFIIITINVSFESCPDFLMACFLSQIHVGCHAMIQVCQHLPTVLTFIVWITDKVLQDRYSEEVNKVSAIIMWNV